MFIGYLLLAIAAVALALGLRFLLGYHKQAATFWYGLFAISVAIYVGANGLGFAELLAPNSAERLAWTGGMLTAVFILPFSFAFPLQRRTSGELASFVAWPLIVLVPTLLFTDLLVSTLTTESYGSGYATPTGPYFWWMVAFFAVYWVWALVNFMRSYRASDGIHRSSLRALLIGLAVSLAAATYFDIFMPLTGAPYLGYIGALVSAVWLGFTGYILVKR